MPASVRHITILLKRILILIAAFEFSRILFLLFNWYAFVPTNASRVITDLFFGLRFDIATICFFNALFILLHIIPWRIREKNSYQKWVKILFIFTNAVILIFNFSDIEYFKFQNKRSTADLFAMLSTGDDFLTLLPEYIFGYWYLVLLWAVTIWGLWKAYPKYKAKDKSSQISRGIGIQIILIPVVILLCIVSIRGIHLRPLSIIRAASYTRPQNIPVVLNTPFSIMKTLMKDDLQRLQYFEENESEKYFNPISEFKDDRVQKKQNVVVIVLESFSQEYCGYITGKKTYTPNLDTILSKSMVFSHGFANGTRSMEAIPSIVSSIPSLMNNPFITSQFSSNEIMSLPLILKKNGYRSSFFHGGKNGTMGFDGFCKLAGIDEYYGMNEFPDKSKYDGKWGIWDEDFLSFTADKLDETNNPFAAYIFTLSSHHPYSIPKERENEFPSDEHEILRAVRYADDALGKFFRKIETKAWYKNTLFVFCADHTSFAFDRYYISKVGKYAIPVAFFNPADSTLCGNDRLNIVQQADIFPSVLDYLNIDDPIIAFGNSVFDKNAKRFSISYSEGIYQLITNEYVLQFDGENPIGYFEFPVDSMLRKNLVDSLPDQVDSASNRIKAILQEYTFRMTENNLSIR